jgi:hypothetical protein
LTEKKKKVGRPRKYASRAERQKAYYERKKKKMKNLEEKVEQLKNQKRISIDIDIQELEDIIFKDIQTVSWKKITPGEIALMGTKELQELVQTFKERMEKSTSFVTSIENILLAILSKNHYEAMEELHEEKIAVLTRRIQESAGIIEERMQQQTLLYLMEAELANRERLEERKTKLDIFEAKIEALEQQVKK